MNEPKAILKNAWPYQQDTMNLPVRNLKIVLPFYENILGFRLTSRHDTPNSAATLSRDAVQIGLVENGGDPTQDGCFFEVDDVQTLFAELKARGLPREQPEFSQQQHGNVLWKVLFITSPDGLCYCYGERQN